MPGKVYCIVKEGDYVYIPVKAEKNPYQDKDAYLKNLPNFFGGTINKIEYRGRTRVEVPREPCDALAAELYEESRKKIQIDQNTIGSQMRDGTLLEARVGDKNDLYWFGLINVQENPAHPIVAQGRLLSFTVPSQDRAENEMKYLLKVTVDSIIQGILPADADALYNLPIDQINPEVIDKMANKILSACGIILPGNDSDYFIKMLNDDAALKDQWNASETKKAFAKLAAVLYKQKNESM